MEVGREERSPLLRVQVDRERAADLGLRISEIGQALRTAVDGTVPTRFLHQGLEIDVRLQLPRHAVRDAERLGDLVLFRDNGSPLRLREVADFQLSEGPAHIERENQVRITRVIGDINTSVSDVATIMQTVESRLAGLELPERYSLLFGGQWETIQETRRELGLVLWLAAFLVFIVLAVQYERLSNPLVILAAAPLALIGVVAMLWFSATPLSAPVLIGGILLIGIVVNNAILLVEYIEIGRRSRGLAMREAIVEAGAVRLRPILMTTSTTVLGMTPLAIGMGAGTEIMRPLALAVVGGLLVAMLMTLFVVPSLYLVVSQLSEWLKAFLTGSERDPERALKA